MTVASLVVLTIAAAETLTGNWSGARDELADIGLTFDVAFTTETFYVLPKQAGALMGHLDLALTVDTGKLGLWPGGKLYVLGQVNEGDGVNALVGSQNEISNLEARGFTQVAEAFYEQTLWEERIRFRIGKQDSNRDFGTPRYAGNFINNNFGMYPTALLPSYPAPGLGATATVDPLWWLSLRAAVYQGTPQIGGFSLSPDEGAIGVGGVALKHVFPGRHGGTTSLGGWAHTNGEWGVMFQNDERIYSHPENPDDGRGLNFITRFSWSKTSVFPPLYLGASLAWHGLWARDNDTVGAGFGYFQRQGGGEELFFEVFYKARLTHWLSVQPDVQVYRVNEAPSALFGLRAKLKI
ncbi:MAG: carbohydrate porin [Myxococcaceae bacterium]|nr:carbohydrate porin [Myxococcaceae bacterium]